MPPRIIQQTDMTILRFIPVPNFVFPCQRARLGQVKYPTDRFFWQVFCGDLLSEVVRPDASSPARSFAAARCAHSRQTYFNSYRTHASLKGQTPIESARSRGLNINPIAGSSIVELYTKPPTAA